MALRWEQSSGASAQPTLAPPPYVWGWAASITGLLTLGSAIFSLRNARQHLAHGNRPGEYKYTVRILTMVPIYSVQSWFSLFLKLTTTNELLSLGRKAYECIVIFAFLQLITFQIGGSCTAVAILSQPDHQKYLRHPCFVSCVIGRDRGIKSANGFVRNTLRCVLLYVPATLISACLVLLANADPGLAFARPLGMLILNVTQIIAMYCLILFGYAIKSELAPIRPWGKFLSVKVMLMFTNMQEFAMHFYCSFYSFPVPNSEWTPEQSADAFLNGLICFEMFLLALFHQWIYRPGELENTVGHMCHEPDHVTSDFWDHEPGRRRNVSEFSSSSWLLSEPPPDILPSTPCSPDSVWVHRNSLKQDHDAPMWLKVAQTLNVWDIVLFWRQLEKHTRSGPYRRDSSPGMFVCCLCYYPVRSSRRSNSCYWPVCYCCSTIVASAVVSK